MSAIRKAHVVWTGDLMKGKGTIETVSSGAYSGLPVTWASRTEEPGGKTSPEELLASAHASCFCMAFSNMLAKAGHAPERLEVTAEVTFEQVPGGFKVKSSALDLKGRVPGIDAERFRTIAEDAKENCPISQAIKGNVELRLKAQLQG